MAAGKRIKVRPGDTTASVAFAHGLFWETVWDHPDNAELKKKRAHQNILLEGDELFVPDKRMKIERCKDGKRHVFVKKGVPEKLRMRCLDWEGKARTDTVFELLGDDGSKLEGRTDGDGWLEAWIMPNVRSARLLLGTDAEQEEIDLDFGHLDPLPEVNGVAERLRNLGYYAGPKLKEKTEELSEAIVLFRRDAGLQLDDTIDDDLCDALRKAHGS